MIGKPLGERGKRRIGSTCKKKLSEGGEEQGKKGMRPVSSGKRGFCLLDEEDSQEKDNHEGKKQKLKEESMIICHNLVEEVSHKWPQRDQ